MPRGTERAARRVALKKKQNGSATTLIEAIRRRLYRRRLIGLPDHRPGRSRADQRAAVASIAVMAGLVPAIPIHETRQIRQYYVYILASRLGGAIYVGVTNDLARRTHEHRNGVAIAHTKRYGIRQLVHFEAYENIRDALQREKNMKHWPRVYKTRPIAQSKPGWRDLYEEIAGPP